VIVAISGFFRVGELERFGRIRRSALLLALIALVGVLVLGVLPGLLVAVVLSLILLIKRLSRPPVVVLARDPDTGAWGRAERHPAWTREPGQLVVRSEGPLFYANAVAVKEHLLELVQSRNPGPHVVVLDLSGNHELDLETIDMLAELNGSLAAGRVELRLGAVHVSAAKVLRRAGLDERVRIEPTLEAATGPAHA
jgi:SulP family sulfate permease